MQPINIFEDLKSNAYPGRGIVIGKSEDGKSAVAAYFIMGRSVNSRNRVFIQEGENLRTQAHDPALLTDPSLVIYYPVRMFDGGMIVTNGDQTDTIYNLIHADERPCCVGSCFVQALRTRTFEPDPPLFTPRISGIIEREDGDFRYRLSILKSTDGNPAAAQRQFFEYDPLPGLGHFIHTYKCDGNPVPSFEGEPKPVRLSGDIDSLTQGLWESLNADNKVSLFVRTINLESGESDTRIVNKNK